MPTQEKIQVTSALDAYPRITSPASLFSAANAIKVITVCGKLMPEECTYLQRLLPETKLVFQQDFHKGTVGKAPRETLLFLARLTPHQIDRLLAKLYDADALVCGIVMPELFTAP